MIPTLSYAARSASTPLTSYSFDRRYPRDTDVVIDILYGGVCHSKLHTVRDEWSKGMYPILPGHEIVGRVKRVGKRVTKFSEACERMLKSDVKYRFVVGMASLKKQAKAA